jgi:hypothetical protein
MFSVSRKAARWCNPRRTCRPSSPAIASGRASRPLSRRLRRAHDRRLWPEGYQERARSRKREETNARMQSPARNFCIAPARRLRLGRAGAGHCPRHAAHCRRHVGIEHADRTFELGPSTKPGQVHNCLLSWNGLLHTIDVRRTDKDFEGWRGLRSFIVRRDNRTASRGSAWAAKMMGFDARY